MALSSIQNSFVAGEISMALLGRTDLAKWHQGGSTVRNFFVNYRGGASSRAGLAYVGTCKQPGTSAAPRDIPFQFSLTQGYALEFGDQYMRIKSNGAYVLEAANAITGITQANPGTFAYTNTNYTLSNGDWIAVAGVGGMTNFNGLVWIVQSATTTHFTVTDLFGNPVNTTLFNAYTSGGTLSRIYTVVSPYAAVDLPYLKYTQSADTMTLCCVNQATLTEYPPYELVRHGATNWTFTQDTFGSNISPPTGVTATAQASTALSTFYSYVVTAIDRVTGQESVASSPASVENNDIAINAGSNTVTWNAVTGAGSYNVYKATPAYAAGVPIGVLYGFVGSALATSFVDTNITADFTVTPPTHNDPFSRGEILAVTVTAQGTGYTQATIGFTITTSTGSGFVGTPVVIGGKFVSFIVVNTGKNYAAGDTIAITDSGTGAGATATLTVGPQSGTYPSTCAYYQQRRVYASTLNNPDTYYMSQSGAFTNMDSSIPTTDSDAIVGTPWAQQVNGIQFLVPMTGGLVTLTGNGAWQVNGGNSAALTPADQTATAQAYNGCHNHVPPIIVNYDILYVQAKGSIVRDLSYNFFVNIYTGTDMTVLSNQLFSNYQIQQWAYAEEPFKLIWCIRNDGNLLSLTYLKEQDVYGWARHDTNGLFVGVCAITEPPVDAAYFIVKRYVRGQWMYYSERMDNRNWPTVESCFCVDAGLSYPMTFPNATLTPAAASGTNNISAVNLIFGGSHYTAPTFSAVDPTGQGTGATFSATVVGGVITSVTAVTQGQNYQPGTVIQVFDATGSGAVIEPIITNNVVFNASASVFTNANVGDVIRYGGGSASIGLTAGFQIGNGFGKAVVTQFNSGTQVVANIIQPITATVPNDPNNTPIPATSGNWSITTPTTVVSGLNHLEGLTVAILADGSVVPNQVVTNGSITLPHPASAITIGLPYLPQVQTMYLDPQGLPMTSQGKRKSISAVTVRMQASRGMSVGTNQPDAQAQPSNATIAWTNMKAFKERNATIQAGAAIPLFTGDERILVPGDWDVRGQVAIQQSFPLPANVLAVVPEFQVGDTPG